MNYTDYRKDLAFTFKSLLLNEQCEKSKIKKGVVRGKSTIISKGNLGKNIWPIFFLGRSNF